MTVHWGGDDDELQRRRARRGEHWQRDRVPPEDPPNEGLGLAMTVLCAVCGVLLGVVIFLIT